MTVRVLITHPHDGHGPNDTCLDCQSAQPSGSDHTNGSHDA